MNRRKHHLKTIDSGPRQMEGRPDTPGELRNASLSNPFFREVWNTSSKMSWKQFVARWEARYPAPGASGSRRR